jgi:hypothetical protein
MNKDELDTIDGTGFMVHQELSYVRHNKRLWPEIVKAMPLDQVIQVVQTWLAEWERMADEMMVQVAQIHGFGRYGGKFCRSDAQVDQYIADFRSRMEKLATEAGQLGFGKAIQKMSDEQRAALFAALRRMKDK